jgi:hypothetical protein
MLILGKGKGGAEIPLAGSCTRVSCAPVVIGQDVASSEEGMNLSGSNDGRLGYLRQSPIAENAV